MYSKRLKSLLLTLLLSGLFCFASFGQGKNFSISKTLPSWLVKIDPVDGKPKSKDVSDGYYAALVEQQNQIDLQEAYIHVMRQIVSDAGVQNGSQVSVTYDPSYQKLIFHKITVWRDGKATDKLNAAKFKVLQNEKDLSRFIYSGTYDAYLILDDIRKGDRIEFAYTLKGENPIFGNKYTGDLYFENSSSVEHMYTNLIVNKDRKLKFKNFNFKGEPKITETKGLKVYEWESRQTKTYRTTDYEPSWYNPFKHIQVTEYQSWNDVVNWGLKTNSYPNLKTPLLDKKVQELFLKAKQDTAKYIGLAMRFVQDEVRYMGVEMGEYSHRPNSPEKVLQQRYGDCKDKSLLLVHMLGKVGVQAYMAYIDTYSGKKLEEYMPSPTLFNHVVVRIDYHQKIWVDPTISYQRGAYDSVYFPNYGFALVIKPGTAAPEEVISIATGKLVANLTFDVADSVEGKKTKLKIVGTYTDNYADNMRSLIADDGEDGVAKTFLEYITKYYPDIESTGFNITDNEQTNTIEITESYNIENIWSDQEGDNPRRYAYFYGDLIDSELRSITAKSRKEPLALKFPVNIEQIVSINLPAMWNLRDESEKVETDNYYFEFNSFRRGNNIKLNYAYRSLKDYIDGKDIKQYVKDTKKVNDWLSYGIYYGGGSADNKGDLNPYFTVLGILALVISAFFFARIYQQKSEFDIEKIAEARAIGGWLVFIGISLSLAPFILIWQLSSSGFYQLSNWESYETASLLNKFLIGAIIIFEVIANSVMFGWIILSLFLFFNRREIFPKFYLRYLIFLTTVTVLDLIAGGYINYVFHRPFAIPSDITQTLRVMLFSAIWSTYISKSERVQQTFVFTYPDSQWKKALIEYHNKFFSAQQTEQQSPQNNNNEVKEIIEPNPTENENI